MLCEAIVTDDEPPAEHCGAADTGELQDIPGPETVQVALSPFTPVAFQVMVDDCPARTRSGVAVIERFVLAPLHAFDVTVTFGQYDTGVEDVSTFIAYVPGVLKVRVAVEPVP